MKLFVCTMLGLLVIDLLGKLLRLYTRDTYKQLGHTAADAVITAAVLVWGAFVLGGA